MPITFMQHLKDGVIYKKIKQPFRLIDVANYFALTNYVTQAGTPPRPEEIKGKLNRATSQGTLVKAGGFDLYFFPDMPISDSAYLTSLLKELRAKIKKSP